MPWRRFLALLPIPLWTRPDPPKMARASRIILVRPFLLTARRSQQTMKMIRERINYVVRGLDPLRAGSTFPGGALAIAQGHRTAAKHHPRRIAIFGGSFDPIHNGHLSAARAADRRFNFDEIHFIPASRPPHKLKQHLAPFPHRFAMVALACTEHPHFVPSVALRLVIPPELMGRDGKRRDAEAVHESSVVAHLHRTSVYLLENVASEVSATDIRRRTHRGQAIHGLVATHVEEYILKQGLYR